MFARGILERKKPSPTKEEATITPELCKASKGMLEGAKRDVGSVPKSAVVATLIPEIVPVEIAVAGIVPGAKTVVGNVLNNAEVGTLNSPVPLATRLPPTNRIPVEVFISRAN